MLGGLGPPGASRHPLKAPDSALPGQKAGREGLDQGPALDSSCEPKGGRSPGVPKLDESAGCSGVKSRRVKTLCVWGWLLPSTCVSSRQGQARSLCSPQLPCPVPGTEEVARGQLAFLWSLAGGPCPPSSCLNPAPLWHTLASSAQPRGLTPSTFSSPQELWAWSWDTPLIL